MSLFIFNLFHLVLEASWQSSVIILLILLVRPLMNSRVPARWRYLLWGLVLIRLLVPISFFPPTPVSLQNLEVVEVPMLQVERVLSPPQRIELFSIPIREERDQPPATFVKSTPLLAKRVPSARWHLVSTIWLIGVLLSLGFMIYAQVRFWRRRNKNWTQVDAAIMAIWENCCHRLRIRNIPALHTSPDVTSPALVGFIRPALLVPQKNLNSFSKEDWENVFVHELAHYQRGDYWINGLHLFALSIHWFNPIVWIGLRQLRADRELAADEWTLQHLEPEKSVAYGQTLLKVIKAQSSGNNLAMAAVGLVEDHVQLKQRLQRIVAFGPRTLLGTLLGLGIVVVMAMLVLGRESQFPFQLQRTTIRSIASVLGKLNPQAAMALAKQIPPNLGHDIAVNEVINQWILKDPQAAAPWAQNLPASTQKTYDLQQIASGWAVQNPKAAIAYANAIADKTQKEAFIRNIAFALMPTDGLAGMALLNGLPDCEQKINDLDNAIGIWAQHDPKAAVNYAINLPSAGNIGLLPENGEKWMLFMQAMGTFANTNPDAALAFAEKLPSQDKDIALREVVDILLERNPKAVEALVKTLPEGKAKNRAISGFIGRLANTDLPAALERLYQLAPGEAKNDAQCSLAIPWSQNDLTAATAYGLKIPAGRERRDFFQNIAAQLFSANYSAAANWLSKLPDVENKNQLVKIFAPTWVQRDVASAAAFAPTLPPGSGQTRLVNDVAYQMAGTDPAKAMDWVRQLPDGNARNAAADMVRAVTTANDIRSLPDGTAKQKAIIELADRWSQNDPSTAAKWLNTLPESPEKAAAAANVITNWCKNDFDHDAVFWIYQLPTGSTKDSAMTAYSNNLFNVHPEQAVRDAQSIGDPKAQQAQVTTLLRRWMQTDPAKATAAVQGLSLPDDVKAQLLQTKR